MEFEAIIHGAEIKKPKESGNFQPVGNSRTEQSGGYLFKPQAEYDKMTPEERQRESDRLLKITKQWAGNSGLGS